MDIILPAIFGLMGIILGIVLNEIFRRRSRIEYFSTIVFEKRLNIYEQLYKKIQEAGIIVEDVISNPEYTEEERNQAIFVTGLDIAKFNDENEFYIDKDLGASCTALLLGDQEKIFYIDDENEKQKKQVLCNH